MSTNELKDRQFAIVSRSRTFRNIVKHFALGEKSVLDVGCSYGEYTAHFGLKSVGITTNPREVEIGLKRGLDVRLGNAEHLEAIGLPNSFDFIWANNLFEHLLAPHAFLMNLRRVGKTETVLLLGVPVLPFPYFLTLLRKFRGAFHDSHINFYSWRTLKLTVEAAGWSTKDVRPFICPVRLLDRLLLFIAPHVYVVATKDLSFAYSRGKVQEWEHDPMYETMLKAGSTDHMDFSSKV
jgi:SAM-dependent methyltransferase